MECLEDHPSISLPSTPTLINSCRSYQARASTSPQSTWYCYTLKLEQLKLPTRDSYIQKGKIWQPTMVHTFLPLDYHLRCMWLLMTPVQLQRSTVQGHCQFIPGLNSRCSILTRQCIFHPYDSPLVRITVFGLEVSAATDACLTGCGSIRNKAVEVSWAALLESRTQRWLRQIGGESICKITWPLKSLTVLCCVWLKGHDYQWRRLIYLCTWKGWFHPPN